MVKILFDAEHPAWLPGDETMDARVIAKFLNGIDPKTPLGQVEAMLRSMFGERPFIRVLYKQAGRDDILKEAIPPKPKGRISQFAQKQVMKRVRREIRNREKERVR